MLLAFDGKPQSLGWVVVDARSATFTVDFAKLRRYPPFRDRGRRRVLNTFRNTRLWRHGRSNEVPALSLDEVERRWTTIQSDLNVIVSVARP